MFEKVFIRVGTMNIDKDKLINFIKKLSEPKVLVIGDLALDEMIYGDAERISREAPVLILQHTKTKLIFSEHQMLLITYQLSITGKSG